MMLEIYLGKGIPLETGHCGKYEEMRGGWFSQVGREGYGVGLCKALK